MNDCNPQKKVIIVDDHPIMREGLRLRLSLQRDLLVCGEAATESEAMKLIEENSPDLLLVDISLKPGNGLDLIKRVKSQCPRVKMLVNSCFDESLYAERALRAGASGYLNKQESSEKLLEAVRTVLAGKRYFSEELAQRLISQSLGEKEHSGSPMESLTNRELEVFRLIGEGLSTSEISKQLFISTHTIDTHREHIKSKLGCSNARELSRTAIQWVDETA